MIPVYQYLNLQSLTVTSVQQHVPIPPSRFLSLPFPLNLKQWCQPSRVRLIKEKHLYKRQKQLYAITEVRWNSGPQMVMHCPKCKTILLIADRQRRTTGKLKSCYYWNVICTFHLYMKKDLYFAPKIKRSNIFWEIQWLGHLRN